MLVPRPAWSVMQFRVECKVMHSLQVHQRYGVLEAPPSPSPPKLGYASIHCINSMDCCHLDMAHRSHRQVDPLEQWRIYEHITYTHK